MCRQKHWHSNNCKDVSAGDEPNSTIFRNIKADIADAFKEALSAPFLFLISVYRTLISPIIPSRCIYTPTCSRYAYDAILKYGPIKGGFLAIKRILRCRPGMPGGYDPVP
ncbi:MAG: putative membrane protein insertion efficiency factor [bacterium ADurb.Bin132]|nr:MAG: putative membrane protein insertion efficiency factor [bacterium ADurb.Bin132]